MAEPATQRPSIPLIKRLLRIIGVLISVTSLAFVGFSIHRSFGDLTENIASARFFAYVATASLLYACLVQLIGTAWYHMMIAMDNPSLGFKTALAIFNRSNVYKYLPGNVFHMVGRYALAKAAGASHSSLAFSQVVEIALLALSSMIIAFAFSSRILMDALLSVGLTERLTVMSLTALIVVGVAVAAICIRVGILRLGRRTVFKAFRVLAIYLIFFLGSGLLAALLTASIFDADTATLVSVVGIASSAWLLGFLVPGAPGGLGVREAIMIGGFTAIGIPLAHATAVAVGHRIATVVGDAIPALIEFVMRQRGKA